MLGSLRLIVLPPDGMWQGELIGAAAALVASGCAIGSAPFGAALFDHLLPLRGFSFAAVAVQGGEGGGEGGGAGAGGIAAPRAAVASFRLRDEELRALPRELLRGVGASAPIEGGSAAPSATLGAATAAAAAAAAATVAGSPAPAPLGAPPAAPALAAIITPARSLIIGAEFRADLDDWVAAIRALVANEKGRLLA
jgi:hypothetical protein